MWLVKDDEVDDLLTREARSQVSFARLLLIYLFPFALLKSYDADTHSARERAVAHNRSVRWMLPLYIRRWLVIAAAFVVATYASGALSQELPAFAVPAAVCGAGSCFSVSIVLMTAIVYLALSLDIDL